MKWRLSRQCKSAASTMSLLDLRCLTAKILSASSTFGDRYKPVRTLSVVCIGDTVIYTNHFIGVMSKCQHIPKVTRCNVDLSLCI